MISENYANKFCREDISLIENYDKAINDKTQIWQCHHRLETDKGLSKQELIDTGKYFDVEAKDLIFLTERDHKALHRTFYNKNIWKGTHHSEKTKDKLRGPRKKYKCLLPNGEIIEISSAVNINRYHPDWKKIGEV